MDGQRGTTWKWRVFARNIKTRGAHRQREILAATLSPDSCPRPLGLRPTGKKAEQELASLVDRLKNLESPPAAKTVETSPTAATSAASTTSATSPISSTSAASITAAPSTGSIAVVPRKEKKQQLPIGFSRQFGRGIRLTSWLDSTTVPHPLQRRGRRRR